MDRIPDDLQINPEIFVSKKVAKILDVLPWISGYSPNAAGKLIEGYPPNIRLDCPAGIENILTVEKLWTLRHG